MASDLINKWRSRIRIKVSELAYAQARRPPRRRHRDRADTDSEQALPKLLSHGRFCDQVIDEVRKIKHRFTVTGRTMAEIRQEHPKLAVWNVVAALSQEDRETFERPRTWGPTVGYARQLLGKYHDRSAGTIRNWVKAYRRHLHSS